MKHLEQIKDDNTKYFYVMRDIQKTNRNTKSTVLIKDKEGNVPGTNEGKIKVIEEYFRNTLAVIYVALINANVMCYDNETDEA